MRSTAVALALTGLLALSSGAPLLQGRDTPAVGIVAANADIGASSPVADASHSTTSPASFTSDAATRSTPTASASCSQQDVLGTSRYTINLHNWPQDQRGCGRGTLDNLRGQCSIIEAWTCDYTDPAHTNATISFNIASIHPNCVKDAVYLSSQGAGINPPVEGLSCSPPATRPASSADRAAYLAYLHSANAPHGY